MIRTHQNAALVGCLLSSMTLALPSFAQAPPAAPVPAAEAAKAPPAPPPAPPPVKAGTTPPPNSITAIDANTRSTGTADAPPVALSSDDKAKKELGTLRERVDAWRAELPKSAPLPADAAARDKTDKTLSGTLEAISSVEAELARPKTKRIRAPFKAFSAAMIELSAAVEERDKARDPSAPEGAPPALNKDSIEEARKAALDAAPEQAATAGRKVTLEDDSDFNYGLTVSLFRLSVARLDDEPARIRNYSPKFEALPAEFGFQFTYRPSGAPWRLRTSSKNDFQLMSAGGILLARVNSDKPAQGEIGIAATWQFLEDSIGLGLGFDLYRGVPVQGPDGQRGGATAYTGLFSWAFARDGEVTPENVFVLLTVNVAGLAGKISTKGSDQ